jgi:putative NADH-flavin reductase
MQLLILGATGRTGRAVVKRAKAAGHHVTAFGRRPAEQADTSLTGAFGDDTFAEAVHNSDAVLSCLASSNSDAVCSRAAEAVQATDPQMRFLTVAGAGVDRPSDAKGIGDKLVGAVMRVVVGKMLADRQREIDMLAASEMRWTALRPPRLTEGRSTGIWRFDHDRPHATWIDREDLAGAMLEALGCDDMIGTAPFVSAAS